MRFQWILADDDPAWPDLAMQLQLAAHRVVRLAWLSVLLMFDHPALYRDYRGRFGLSIDTFRRDKRKLHRTSMWIAAILFQNVRRVHYLERTTLD